MSDQTFEQLWKKLIIYQPELPITIAQDCVNNAYKDALSSWNWSALRKWSQVTIKNAYRTGTVTVTNGSPNVTGLGTTWTSTMLGMQFSLNESPFYDISTVTSPTTLTLTENYKGADASGASYTISQIYIDLPSDFGSIEDVIDLTSQKRLHTRFSQENLNLFDPNRLSTGSPVIAAYSMPTSAYPNRLELWPRPPDGEKILYIYEMEKDLLSARTDRPIPPLNGDIIREGALAELCLWPGMKDSPNPYFDATSYGIHAKRFAEKVADAQVSDRALIQQFKYAETSKLDYAPLDANFIQAHGGIWF
jgi:hypothetical protein